MADYRQLQETRQRNGISININITILEIYTYIWTLYRDAFEGFLTAVYGFSFNSNNSFPRGLQQELCKVSSRQREVSLALSELLLYPLTHLFPLPLVSGRRLRVFEAADCKVLGFAPLQLSPSFILSPFSLSLFLLGSSSGS